MPHHLYAQIKTAFKYLNPHQVRELAERPIRVGLVSSSEAGYEEMEDFLLPVNPSEARRAELNEALHRIDNPGVQDGFDVVLCDDVEDCPPDAFRFYRNDPERTAREVLELREELGLPLARYFRAFRKPVAEKVIHNIAKENAIFAAVTALPDVVPSLIELPWAVSEFTSDTAFITMNQIRMAFLLAGASDHSVGYSEQRAQIATIVGGAFGWRALARELVGKIPFGAGIIPKAAVAYAGTFVVGKGLEKFYSLGYRLTRSEREKVYQDALERGKGVVAAFSDLAKMRGANNRRRLAG